jgi:hypothetical protein
VIRALCLAKARPWAQSPAPKEKVKSEPVAHTSYPNKVGRIAVWGQHEQIGHKTPSQKQSEKWIGVVAEAVEHLLCMHKALNSNPSTTPHQKLFHRKLYRRLIRLVASSHQDCPFLTPRLRQSQLRCELWHPFFPGVPESPSITL